ncbi:methyltransferase domain-containing protein, partial [Mesorhizobium sp. M7A.F.Ca.US.005.03.2.1]|uniref:SAM-dependent methyltransferase n=3 Tax=unclassified Mesorhizobium TaxID=325217 RepID=UPI001FE0C9C5
KQIAALNVLSAKGSFGLAPSPTDRILDVGSGIGGPARFLAATYGCQVDGVDLTPAFVEASGRLTMLSGLDEKVRFHEADAARPR